MAFTGNFLCTSLKTELLKGFHDFEVGGDLFLIALYTNSATFDASTTTAIFGGGNNEVATSGGYTSGGPTVAASDNNLTNETPNSGGTTAHTSFDNKTFAGSTITARGALIYNAQANSGTDTANAVCVLDFGADKTSTSGNFQIVFPDNNSTDALIRIA